MPYLITNTTRDVIEFIFGDNVVMLSPKNKNIKLTQEEFDSIPKHKSYLFENGFLSIEEIVENKEVVKVVEVLEVKEVKQKHKKR